MSEVFNTRGSFQLGGNAAVYSADASLCGDALTITVDGNDEPLSRTAAEGWRFGADIPGLPLEVRFADGAVFTPADPAFRWYGAKGRRSRLATIESNVPVMVVAALLTPLLFWWVLAVAMPAVAVRSVAFIPESVPREMGEQTSIILDRLYLDSTALDDQQQQRVRDVWDHALSDLSIDSRRYDLQFRASDQLGANALALPNGTVIVTDELVTRLGDNDDAMLAILLHEIGHVENRHSLKLVAQSVATSLFFAAFLGDIEGAGELILGAGTSLMQNAFSREMESEADEFAFGSLEQLHISPAAFALALESILEQEEGGRHDVEVENTLTHYLSTHPAIAERIRRARQRAVPADNQGADEP